MNLNPELPILKLVKPNLHTLLTSSNLAISMLKCDHLLFNLTIDYI